MRSGSTISPTDDEVVEMSGAPATTSTVSRIGATLRSKSMAWVCATLTSTLFFDTVVKPINSAVTSNVPTGNASRL